MCLSCTRNLENIAKIWIENFKLILNICNFIHIPEDVAYNIIYEGSLITLQKELEEQEEDEDETRHNIENYKTELKKIFINNNIEINNMINCKNNNIALGNVEESIKHLLLFAPYLDVNQKKILEYFPIIRKKNIKT